MKSVKNYKLGIASYDFGDYLKHRSRRSHRRAAKKAARYIKRSERGQIKRDIANRD